MSADDADDGFDKEAEREKLREKYEADQQKRESTQKMSELLLQGATMTNQHCDTCGNPLFRYEGRTFCPSCQGEEAETTTGPRGADETESAEPEAATSEAAGEAEAAAEQGTEATRERSARETGANEPSTQGVSEPTGSEAASRQPERTEPTTVERTTTERTTERGEPAERTTERVRETPTRTPERSAPAAGDDLAAARESVRATLNDLAARAERSNDAAHTRELLAATKEAAQTLRELNRLS